MACSWVNFTVVSDIKHVEICINKILRFSWPQVSRVHSSGISHCVTGRHVPVFQSNLSISYHHAASLSVHSETVQGSQNTPMEWFLHYLKILFNCLHRNKNGGKELWPIKRTHPSKCPDYRKLQKIMVWMACKWSKLKPASSSKQHYNNFLSTLFLVGTSNQNK
jgi:hypothetical protein